MRALLANHAHAAILVALVVVAGLDLAIIQASLGPRPGPFTDALGDYLYEKDRLEAGYAERVWAYTLAGTVALIWLAVSRLRAIQPEQRRHFLVSLATAGVGGLIAILLAAITIDTFPLSVRWEVFAIVPGAALLLAGGGLMREGPGGPPRQAYSAAAQRERHEPLHRWVPITAATITVANVLAAAVALAKSPRCEGPTPDLIESLLSVMEALTVLAIATALLALLVRRPFTGLAVLVVNIVVLMSGALSSGALCT